MISTKVKSILKTSEILILKYNVEISRDIMY